MPLSSSGETAILEEPSPSTIQGPRSTEMSGTDAYEFIRTCLSHRTEAARREALQPFIDSGIDWELVQREARRHRVLPLLFHVLENLMGERLPSSLREQGREHRRSVRIQNTFVIQELERIIRRFEEAGLPILTLKGPTLAQTAYGDIDLRRSVDTDVLVPRNRFSDADRLLHEIGYEYAGKRKGTTGWRKKLSFYLDGQWDFVRGNSFALDVHTRLMPPGYSFPTDFEQVWERSRSVRLGECIMARGLSPEDQILLLTFHGVKNEWRSIRYVTDIAGAIRGKPHLDWSPLLERSQRMNATRVLRLGLYLAHDLLDASLPEDVRKWTREKPLRRMSALVKDHLRNRHQTGVPPYGKRVRLQLATKDTFTDCLRYGAYSVLQHLWSGFLRP